MKTLVLGMGVSGQSAAQYLLSLQQSVCGFDKNASDLSQTPIIQSLVQQGFQWVQEQNIDWRVIKEVVSSPGIPPYHPLVTQAKQMNIEVLSEVELAFRHCHRPVLGITGTNGKTTVTSLVTHVLNTTGLPAHALGNIGQAVTSKILEIPEQDIFVLELSSFQTECLRQRFLLSGVILNITPDHLDRHQSMLDYARAKFQLIHCLKPGRHFWVNAQLREEYPELTSQPFVKSFGYSSDNALFTDFRSVYLEKAKQFDLPKNLTKPSHDLENLLAAYALCQEVGVSADSFIYAYQSFHKPPHRLEYVADHQGVQFYDDSKGTNVDAVMRAVETFDRPIILIAGGVHKGASYHPWLNSFQGKVKKIYAIGQSAPLIEKELSSEITVELIQNLEQAVSAAANFAKKGDVVLLSPGCSSYDMFEDYVHRGKVFQHAVNCWIKEEGLK